MIPIPCHFLGPHPDMPGSSAPTWPVQDARHDTLRKGSVLRLRAGIVIALHNSAVSCIPRIMHITYLLPSRASYVPQLLERTGLVMPIRVAHTWGGMSRSRRAVTRSHESLDRLQLPLTPDSGSVHHAYMPAMPLILTVVAVVSCSCIVCIDH